MMSLFSSFDAVCSEYIFGHNFGFNHSSSSSTCSSGAASIVENRVKNEKVIRNVHKEQIQQQKKRGPRFAVELDGLNCYETMVSN
ncbi:hypothetical protein ACHQM5_016822 [Ranunculus cassubicifolius]